MELRAGVNLSPDLLGGAGRGPAGRRQMTNHDLGDCVRASVRRSDGKAPAVAKGSEQELLEDSPVRSPIRALPTVDSAAKYHEHVLVRDRVRLAHPAGADQTDAKLRHRRSPPLAKPNALSEHARGL
jgi:hypothetical protein